MMKPTEQWISYISLQLIIVPQKHLKVWVLVYLQKRME
jgi:hypothetical protein